jgi:2,4-dienoyl-CoA reductase-like NADH-dependent reductase (Old Yellow Enzyme family)/NADPH-dependent 2,4-dienoyl-CoA reductase/sulfur reductase-like enzyme
VYPHLLSPIKLGRVTYRNRIFASPTSNPQSCPPEYLTAELRAFFELRAKGGAASVCLGDTIVDTPTGKTHPYKMFIDDPASVPSLSALARDIRRHGAVASVELTHGGKFANVPNFISRTREEGAAVYGPVDEVNKDGIEIREMPEALIIRLASAFGAGAARAKACGFDMISLHGGHGWLIHQFLSPAQNTRKDKYGGSLENRLRFPLMIIESVRRAVGPGHPIEFRLSGAEFTDGGYDLAESVEMARAIAPLVDLLQVSAGIHDNPETFTITHPSMFLPHGTNVFLAEAIKKVVDTPVACIGGLSDPEQMEEIIASGKADVVEMSRALMADPYLPRKAAEGRSEEIVKCMRCFTCMHQLSSTRDMRCALNPVIGREREYLLGGQIAVSPEGGKRVIVAGGGPAGLCAAAEAAKRGHRVTLYEKSGRLGGLLNYEKHVPFKADLHDFIRTSEARARRAGVEILLGEELTPARAYGEGAHALIVAIGARPFVPPVPGLDAPQVLGLDALTGDIDRSFGRKVVIIGGGLVGCETAVHLADTGREVTVIEIAEDWAVDAPRFHKDALRKVLRGRVEILTGTNVREIRHEGPRPVLRAEAAGGTERLIAADSVFVATGFRSDEALVDEYRRAAPVVFVIGDAAAPGQVTQALEQAYYAAADI